MFFDTCSAVSLTMIVVTTGCDIGHDGFAVLGNSLTLKRFRSHLMFVESTLRELFQDAF